MRLAISVLSIQKIIGQYEAMFALKGPLSQIDFSKMGFCRNSCQNGIILPPSAYPSPDNKTKIKVRQDPDPVFPVPKEQATASRRKNCSEENNAYFESTPEPQAKARSSCDIEDTWRHRRYWRNPKERVPSPVWSTTSITTSNHSKSSRTTSKNKGRTYPRIGHQRNGRFTRFSRNR